jgi:hypothetical protein
MPIAHYSEEWITLIHKMKSSYEIHKATISKFQSIKIMHNMIFYILYNNRDVPLHMVHSLPDDVESMYKTSLTLCDNSEIAKSQKMINECMVAVRIIMRMLKVNARSHTDRIYHMLKLSYIKQNKHIAAKHIQREFRKYIKRRDAAIKIQQVWREYMYNPFKSSTGMKIAKREFEICASKL